MMKMIEFFPMIALLLSVPASAETVVGILYGKQEVCVRAKTQGEIKEIKVNEGSSVKTGDVLALIDDRQKVIEYDIAKVEYENAKTTHHRAKKLGEYLSREEREQKEAQYLTKKSMFEMKEVSLENTKITSTIDGVVAKKYIDKGASVAVGDKIFDLVQLDELTLKVYLPASEARELRVGSEVAFKTEFHKERLFFGYVTQISPVIDAVSNTMRVQLSVKNIQSPDGGGVELRPGMVVTLSARKVSQ